MSPPPGHPARLALARALRDALADLPRGALVLVACSGGPDSTALALAAARLARPRRLRAARLRVGLVTVDHGLDAASGARAGAALALGEALGLDPVLRCDVTVSTVGGPEAAARDARHAALADAAEASGAAAVLLAHTRDDQAETVLLRLARGSGARSLAGVPARRGVLRRPLLGLARAEVLASLDDVGELLPDGLPAGLPAADPANVDPALARSRVRGAALPALVDALGPGVVAALARTADLLRDDADLLDALAAQAAERLRGEAAADDPAPDPGSGLPVAGLVTLPPALRRRVLHAEAVAAGSPAGAVTAGHVAALDALVTRPRHGPVALPGAREASVRSGTLRLVAAPATPSDGTPSDGTPPLGVHADVERVLVTPEQIAEKITELARQVASDRAERGPADERPLLLVGVLKGAVMLMADLARALPVDVELDFMAVSSYGSSTSSSGVVRILKDLDGDVAGRDVLVVEDILDSGRTLSWLLRHLSARGPASLEVLTLLRKPAAVEQPVPARYVGFDLPSEFVVGYGLDHAGRYRDLPYVGLLRPEVYAER